MLRKLFLFFFFAIQYCFPALAQNNVAADTLINQSAEKNVHLRISILNCMPGEEIWETFGHACIRVIDSTKFDAERDKIYNYGFFEASEDNTIWDQVFTGRLIDLLDTITYEELMYEYRIKRRGIYELELLLTDSQKTLVHSFLKDNLRRTKRYYEFDTFYDNCSTRIRDLFVSLFGERFVPGKVLPDGSRITFRDVTVTRLCPMQHKYWFGLAVNLLYASRTDRVMSNYDAMFLPPMLFDAFSNATIDGVAIGGRQVVIQEDTVPWVPRRNMPFILIFCFSTIVVSAILFKPNAIATRTLSAVLLICTGLLGLVVWYTWHLDGEAAWQENYNILWALPANLFFPFFKRKIRFYYSIVAIVLLACALVLHVLRVQVMPMLELSSLFVALLFIYGREVKGRFAN